MARRSDLDRTFMLSKEALSEHRRRLALLSKYHVRGFYRRLHDECRLERDGLPSPRAMQELVQAWKLLWRWRR